MRFSSLLTALAGLYPDGQGARADPAEAVHWYRRAAEQGRRWSARRRDEIAAQLTPDQRAEAEARLAARRRAGTSIDLSVPSPGGVP